MAEKISDDDLKLRQPELWADGRRAYEQGQPETTVLMGANAEHVAAFRAGWREAKRQLGAVLED